MTGENTVAPKAIEDMSFKEGLQELDAIVRALESNQLELEDSLARYERGVKLLGALQERLDTAQQKVTVLMGELQTKDDSTDTELS